MFIPIEWKGTLDSASTNNKSRRYIGICCLNFKSDKIFSIFISREHSYGIIFIYFFFSLFMFSSVDIDVYIFLTLYVRFNYWSALQPLIPYHINLLQMLYRFSVLSLALFNKLLDINPKTVKSWLITSYENSVLYGHSDRLTWQKYNMTRVRYDWHHHDVARSYRQNQ